MTTPRLYGYWRSSATWRVRWGFELKGVKYDYVPVNILKKENHERAHLARNPAGALPVLEIEPGRYLAESLAILEWLGETYPKQGPSLYPGDAYARAKIRQLCEIINSGTAPLQTPHAQGQHSADTQERQKWARYWIERGLKIFDQVSAPGRGLYSVGDQPTAADLCLVPQIYNAKRFGVDVKAVAPELLKIFDRALSTPACHRAAPEQQVDAVK
jgi:maleylacetoacetate isomerase/maleylpyruvate isomerase